MEWIINNWLIIVFGLIAVMFFLGYRSKDTHDGGAYEQSGTQDHDKTHKGGHGCCH